MPRKSTTAKPAAATKPAAVVKPSVKPAAVKPAKDDPSMKTQPQRDREDAAANAGGREDVEKAPPAAQPTPKAHASRSRRARMTMKQHPVEQAKGEARTHGKEHLKDVVGDGSNMTATQKKAVQDQEDEMGLEEQAPAEPARGVEHSVGTERKEGIRTAMPESERSKLAA